MCVFSTLLLMEHEGLYISTVNFFYKVSLGVIMWQAVF
jgi:hypothetical protein